MQVTNLRYPSTVGQSKMKRAPEDYSNILRFPKKEIIFLINYLLINSFYVTHPLMKINKEDQNHIIIFQYFLAILLPQIKNGKLSKPLKLQ